jgi:hypothetical protein
MNIAAYRDTPRKTRVWGIANRGPAALRSVQIFRLVLLIQVRIEKRDAAMSPTGLFVPVGRSGVPYIYMAAR